jgi:hypothetical protein
LTFLKKSLGQTTAGSLIGRDLNHLFIIYADAAKYMISPKYKKPLAVTEMGRVHDG